MFSIQVLYCSTTPLPIAQMNNTVKILSNISWKTGYLATLSHHKDTSATNYWIQYLASSLKTWGWQQPI